MTSSRPGIGTSRRALVGLSRTPGEQSVAALESAMMLRQVGDSVRPNVRPVGPRRRLGLAEADQLVHLCWDRLTLEIRRSQLADLDAVVVEFVRLLAHHDAPCWRERLEPRGEIRRVPYRQEVVQLRAP